MKITAGASVVFTLMDEEVQERYRLAWANLSLDRQKMLTQQLCDAIDSARKMMNECPKCKLREIEQITE